MKKFLKVILIVVIVIACTFPLWSRFTSYIAPLFPDLMGNITKENMEVIGESKEIQTEYPIIYYADDVMYSPTNYYAGEMEKYIEQVDAGYSWASYTYSNQSFECRIDNLSKEEFAKLSKESYDLNIESILSGAKAAARSLGENDESLISSDGHLYNICYDNRVDKDTVNHPYPENDKQQLEDIGDENPKFVSYFPCFDLGFSSFFLADAYKNIGFELEHKNTKVTNVMGVTGDEYFDKKIAGYFAVVEDDITTIQRPKEFDHCKWLPEVGKKNHVKYMILYLPSFNHSFGMSLKGEIDTHYIQVLDYEELN